mgnify:CR=1 FL=1
MKLTAEEIQFNWEELISSIETYITGDRKQAMLDFYNKYQDRLMLMGDEENDSYIPQDDKWRREKLGEDYKFNTQVPFASVPDRGLFMLQSHGIKYSFNEMVAIQTHDGLYDEANSKYLKTFMPEQKPRTCLPYIIHQADLMAARIEFEREWLGKLKNPVTPQKKNFTLNDKPKSNNKQQKALGSMKSEGLKNLLDNL